jgi:hypothetical protein
LRGLNKSGGKTAAEIVLLIVGDSGGVNAKTPASTCCRQTLKACSLPRKLV